MIVNTLRWFSVMTICSLSLIERTYTVEVILQSVPKILWDVVEKVGVEKETIYADFTLIYYNHCDKINYDLARNKTQEEIINAKCAEDRAKILCPSDFGTCHEREGFLCTNPEDNLINEFYMYCSSNHRHFIEPKFKLLDECVARDYSLAESRGMSHLIQEPPVPGALIRKRRVIPLALGYAAWFIGGAVISSLGTWGIQAASTWINHTNYMMNDHDDKIVRLEAVERSANISIDSIHQAVKSTVATQNDMARYASILENYLINLRKYAPVFPWLAANMINNMQLQSELFDAIYEGCKNGWMDYKALGRLSRNDSLAHLGEGSGIIEKVEKLTVDLQGIDSENDRNSNAKRNHPTYKFKFWVTVKSQTTKLYKARPFTVYEDLYEQRRSISTYVGPKYMIHDSSNNCSLGLHGVESDVDFIPTKCDRKDFFDRRLTDWTSTVTDEVLEPQIMMGRLHVHIYCLYHNITIDNRTIMCPADPFSIPRSVYFKIGNYEHRPIQRVYHGESAVFAIPNIVHTVKYDSALEATLRGIVRTKEINANTEKQLSQLHEEIRKMDSGSGDTMSTTISYFLGSATITYILIAIIICLIGKCRGRSRRTREGEVVVMNNLAGSGSPASKFHRIASKRPVVIEDPIDSENDQLIEVIDGGPTRISVVAKTHSFPTPPPPLDVKKSLSKYDLSCNYGECSSDD